MCMSSPKIPEPLPPPAPPPPPPPVAEAPKTVRQTQPKKKRRGAQAQLARSSRPTLGGTSGGTGVNMSS
uniref:Uncharacterized protein n=1 Tax=uncultured marine virus TaxID=186617 RepID=A0A0F7LA30_9VIRU|nr:hypothetical protein [uncultured marine virus]